MAELIQYWLGTRLGVLLDLSPEKFGRNTKDGKLLARLLYTYGVIPVHILNNVKESKNFYECYNNLVLLKPWLRYIGVIHDDCTLQKMAGGEGSASISVFYAVYLNLENKDRLHYLSAQKERRISVEGFQKFKVNWVPERFVLPPSEGSTQFSSLVFEKSEMIEWHKEKCRQVVEQIKKTKERFQRLTEKKRELGPILSKHATSQPLDKREAEAQETRQEISVFEAKHGRENPDLNFSELVELQHVYEMERCFEPNRKEAKNFVDGVKRRKKSEVYARSFQHKMQNMLLDEQWKEIVENQDRLFESAVCAKLAKQSQYEKQMMERLYLLRNQRKIFAENRRKIECLKISERQKEYELSTQSKMVPQEEEWLGEEFEKERMAEVHRRIYGQRARARRAAIVVECQKICEALIDIAVRISEARQLIGCQVPKSFIKDLLELFFKDLPIFDVLDHFEELYDQESQPDLAQVNEWGEEEHDGLFFYQSSEYEGLKNEELDRQAVLDECDFNDYIQLMGPWMVELLFPDGSEKEVKNLVLGYIVHRVLAAKYPPPNVPIPVNLKPMKYKSVVQGLKDDVATNILMDLLETRKILVVRVEDAINFVLAAYKEELASVQDIHITFQKTTDDALKQKSSGGKEKQVKKKLHLLKDKTVDKPAAEDEAVEGVADKETQTPKVIADEDMLLSPNADLGKEAFESLGVGDPVPDAVIIPAIIAYVISKQDGYDGWVLLNYPELYSQASDLEYFLTGYRNLPVLDQSEGAEESESYNYRSPWGDLHSKDVFRESRLSRLVPNPYVLSTMDVKVPKTYFDSFIKLKKTSETPRHRPHDFDDLDLMQKFYFDVEILFDFEYHNLNFSTMKSLAKAILKADGTLNVTEKTSLEIFGDGLLNVYDKWDPKRKTTKDTGGLKRAWNDFKPSFTTEASVLDIDVNGERGRKSKDEEERDKESEKHSVETSPKPGDPTWEWAAGPQPRRFQVAQASFWERLEAIYVEDFKNVFFCLRVHRYNLMNYCGFLRKSLRLVMRRSDERQKVLSDFQQMFNEIDEDLRPDEDVKCELHVRVSELEQALMGLADERKKNSLKDTNRMAQDSWVPDELVSLINTFFAAIQLEADRCIGSCQVIMDYYMTLQQRVPEEKPLPKVSVPKLQVQDRKYSITSSMSNKTLSIISPRPNQDQKRLSKSQSEGNKQAQDRSSKTKVMSDKKRRSTENDLLEAAEFVKDILTKLTFPEDGLTPFHVIFMDNVKAIRSDVKNIVEGCIAEAKRGDKQRTSTTRQIKSIRKPSEVNVASAASDALPTEWVTALEDELSRFIFRTQLILARGIFDMNEFLTMILNILVSLTEEVTEMYLKEIQSISECCKVLRCGIEEEVQIRPQLELKDDEFIVHIGDEETPQPEETGDLAYENERERFRFTVDQLCLLFHKLQRVAPQGEIIKRSLTYIFEDLRMLKPEVETCSCFPEIWSGMESDDTATVLNEVYQNLEIVPWKDFIIYALDLPLPSELEILSMRRLFRKYDPQVTELISRENYESISFWFEKTSKQKEMERAAKAKDLLYRMYQVNAFQTNYSALLLAFCKDRNPVVGFEKALALSLGKKIRKYESAHSDAGETRSYDYDAFDDATKPFSDRPTRSSSCSEPTPKCIPKEKITRCCCKDDADESSTEDSFGERGQEFDEQEIEGEEPYYYSSEPFRRSSEACTVPYNILANLLKASFPALPQLSILLDCEQNFEETLNSIYDSLEAFDSGADVHRLINHKFVNRLIFSTNKFKFVKLKPILLSVAKVKSPVPRVMCIADKPKFSNCLRK